MTQFRSKGKGNKRKIYPIKPAIPPIRKNSLEYKVKLKGKNVIKKPNPYYEYKVKTDYIKLKELEELAPKTKYDKKNNMLIQEAVGGRFATEKEMPGIIKKIKEKGWRPIGILPHDVIIKPNGDIKVVDVGNFVRMNN